MVEADRRGRDPVRTSATVRDMSPARAATHVMNVVRADRAIHIPDCISRFTWRPRADVERHDGGVFGAPDLAAVHPGDAALVHAAAGGVGGLLTPMAEAPRRHVVIAAVGTAEKAEIAKRQRLRPRASTTNEEDIAERVKTITGGTGVKVDLRLGGKGDARRQLGEPRKKGATGPLRQCFGGPGTG